MGLTLCFFLLFCLLVRSFWPEGCRIARRLLLGPQWDSFVRCMESIACAVEQGQPLRDAAVGAFRDVLHGY